MFKPARWWSEKNKLKIVFKLQFHASQVTKVEGNGLIISVVPADSSKPTVKSDKATVVDGSCLWESPVYETVKFNQDPKSGMIHERIYYFVIGTGTSKSGVIGEACIDFSNYAEATEVSLVSLPLKNSKTEAILHVSIQRIQDFMDQRKVEESELCSKDHSMGGTIRSNSVEDAPFNKTVFRDKLNMKRRTYSGSDITLSSSESSCGIETPWELQMKNDDARQEPAGCLSSSPHGPKLEVPSLMHKEHQRSWGWLGSSALEASTDDSSSTPRETFLRQHSEEAPDIVIERLKCDLVSLSRQTEMSDLEMQTLRKQIVKEIKRGQDLWREIVCLKEERDALKGECQQLRSSQRRMDEAIGKTSFRFDGVDTQAVVEELRQELNHAKELNANLRIQLQKTQESNSELILAVRDLDEILEQKNREILNPSCRSLAKDTDGKSQEESICQSDYDNDDEEQKALEDLVKEHSDEREAYLLEQQIMDLHSEIEIYKRDKDELEMQMEQLALDYEIMKQANHEMSYKLEQSQIQEQLQLQYECSSSDITANELENHVQNLENELKRLSKEYADSLLTISEVEAHAKGLEKELEKQAQGFEADLEALTRSKVEQEQRAIRAEESLKQMRWKNANTAQRIQEEFKRLSVQMASTFEANENLATKALAEANELRLQKSHLEELLQKASSVNGHYETRLGQLSSQVISMTIQIEQMQSETEDKEVQLEHQKKHAEDTQKLFSDEILMLKDEIETHIAKNKILLDDMGNKKKSMHELKQMRRSIKEMELVVEQGNDERSELESRVILLKNEAEESRKELYEMRCLVKEKESIVGNLQSELDSLQSQCMELKHSLSEAEPDKENLRKQVLHLRSDLRKREEAINSMEKKIKDGIGRGATLDVMKAASRASKPVPRGPREVANLEKIKFLEGQIKLKETALETSSKTFLEKEKDLRTKIADLEGRLDVNQSSAHSCENEVKKPAAAFVEDQAPSCRFSKEAGGVDKNSSTISNITCSAILSKKISNGETDSTNSTADIDELKNEIELLNKRNKSMEGDLKEMQKRYSDISLRFAEVEGERQQLVMKLRNFNNSNKSM